MSAFSVTITARRPGKSFTAIAAPSGSPMRLPSTTAPRLILRLRSTMPRSFGSPVATRPNAWIAASPTVFIVRGE